MLSSRAAAFSVKALLNPNSDRSKDSQHTKQSRKKRDKTKNKHDGDAFRECQGITDTTGMSMDPSSMEQDTKDPRMLPLGTHPFGSHHHPDDRLFNDDNRGRIFEEEEELLDVENCMDSPGHCTTPFIPTEMSHPGMASPPYSPMGAVGSEQQTSRPSSSYYPQAVPSPSSSGSTDWQMYVHTPGISTDREGEVGIGNLEPMAGSRVTSQGCSGVTIQLHQRELWSKFNELGTEMIITKSGRRMFPVVKVGIGNLHPDKTYMVYLDMLAVDNRRYRYVYPSSRWMVAGTGEPLSEPQPYIHPDSPATGAQWMAAPSVAFDRLKLTNNKTRLTRGQIILHSMQKYQPRVWVQEVDSSVTSSDLPRLINVSQAKSSRFSETTFITVTAYQNQQITRLKIDSNPFAKGFRDTTKHKELLERRLLPESGSHDGQAMASPPFMMPMMPGQHHHLPFPQYPPHFDANWHNSLSQYGQYPDATTASQFALNTPVSPPMSSMLLSQQWYQETLERAGAARGDPARRLPMMSPAAFYRSRSMPVLFPPYLQPPHAHPSHALDLTKRKDDT